MRPAVPEWTVYGMPKDLRKMPEEPPDHSPLLTLAALLVVAGICFTGVFFLLGPGHLPPDQQVLPVNETGSEVTPEITASGTPVPVVTTSPPTVTAEGIPMNGVWVRVSYPGNYTGAIMANGQSYDVNSSGTRLYQLPVHDTLIEGTVTKTDGSGDPLEVGVYNGGALVSNTSTSRPYGSVDLDVTVGPAVENVPAAATATPTPAPSVPEASVLSSAVPPNGVFVRIAYPGNYFGTLSGSGFNRDVNASGDQVFQLSVSSGPVDGYITKADGSGSDMLVQVYRNGALVTYRNTSSPFGVVDLHTTL